MVKKNTEIIVLIIQISWKLYLCQEVAFLFWYTYTYVYCTYVYIIEAISIARFRRFLISSLDWCIASNNIPIYQICPKSISKNVYTQYII